MPGADGLEVLRVAKKIQPDAEVILVTAYATVDTAIEAMRGGAFHYLMKPFRGEEVVHLAEKAHAQRQLKRENQFLKSSFRGRYQVDAIVGTSPAAVTLMEAVYRIAETDTPVLLSGETGSGRHLCGRVIHSRSDRVGGLFVPVDCPGRETDELSAELLGEAGGSDGTPPRQGKIELAHRGTLYLGGLDEAPPQVQRLVLDFLDRRAARAEGAEQEVEYDVRVVASCERGGERAGDLLPELRDAFRAGAIAVPPLRERPEDIPLLLHHYLHEANRDRKKPLSGFSQTAMNALCAWGWPGNVKELKELVLAIAQKKKQGTLVDAADLPTGILYGRRRRPLDDSPPAAVPTTPPRGPEQK
jgi:DNA-binding NtrC family response regulator